MEVTTSFTSIKKEKHFLFLGLHAQSPVTTPRRADMYYFLVDTAHSPTKILYHPGKVQHLIFFVEHPCLNSITSNAIKKKIG